MKIDILVNDGSPVGVVLKDVYGENGRVGLGGAELALMTMCEAWHELGHQVRLYNSPTTPHGSPFLQFPIDTFIPREDRDILIIFRSPNHRIDNAKGKKIWWSCDQYTVGDFRKFAEKVDKIVTISDFHANHFNTVYGISNSVTIDLPVRTADYFSASTKVKNRMIFCSVPDRGLAVLAQAYPEIKRQVPDTSLVITSDYRLWGTPEARNEQFIRKFLGMDGVRFMGAIPRREMVQEQLKADIQAYPCTYDELFCYSVAECQVAGAYPVTTSKGSLISTNMAKQIPGEASNPHWLSQFIDGVVGTLLNPELPKLQLEVQQKAWDRFSLPRIRDEWEKLFNE